MIWAFLIQACYSLKVLQEIQSSYILAPEEYYIISLDEYYAGDSLSYSISPSTNINLQNPSISTNSSQPLCNFTVPNPKKTTLIQELGMAELTQRYIIIGEGSVLYYIYLNLDTNEIQYLDSSININGTIIQYQAAGVIGFSQSCLVVLSYILENGNYTNKFFYTCPSYATNIQTIEINAPELYFLDTNTIALSKGNTNEYVVVTGYSNGYGLICVYSIKNVINSITPLIATIYISQTQSQSLASILSVVYSDPSQENYYFIWDPQANNLIKLSLNSSCQFEVQATRNIDSVTVYSMELSKEFPFLILGIDDGFIIIGVDLEILYVKRYNIGKNVPVYMTSLNTNYFGLIEGTNKQIQISYDNQGYNILWNFTFELANTTSWGVFNYYENKYLLLYTYDDCINTIEITLNPGYLNFTSSSSEINYTLTISENSNEDVLMKTFSVTPPINDTAGPIQLLNNNQPLSVNFEGLTGSLSLSLSSYCLGYNLSVEVLNIEYENNITYFNASYTITPTITQQKLQNFVSNSNLTHIIPLQNGDLLAYNSLVLVLYENSDWKVQTSFNINPKKVVAIGNTVVANILDPGGDLLMYIDLTNNYNTTIEAPFDCEKLESTDYYLICGSSSVLQLYNLNYNNATHNFELVPNRKIDKTLLNIDFVEFTDYYMYQESMLCVVVNGNILILLDLDYLDQKFTILNTTTPKKTINVLASSIYRYIVFEDFSMMIFKTLELYYIKTIQLEPYTNISIINDYIVTLSPNNFTVYYGLDFVCSSMISQRTVQNWLDFSLFNEGAGLIVYFLTYDGLETWTVTENLFLNTLSILFEIKAPEDISEAGYDANLQLRVFNNYNNVSLTVPLRLFINSQTVYKNDKSIQAIQTNSMDYECNSEATIPLSQIFCGQDVKVNYTFNNSNDQLQRLEFQSSQSLENPISTFLYINEFSVYIIVSGCLATAFYGYDSLIESISIANQSEATCECNSAAFLYEEISYFSTSNSFAFVLGCTIIDNDSGAQEYINYPNNYLFFIKVDLQANMTILSIESIKFIPSFIKSAVTFGGNFTILVSSSYINISPDNLYTNQIMLLSGYHSQDLIVYNSSDLTTTLLKGASYFYITDFEIIYDPMFSTYYLYLADFYYGLKIYKTDINDLSITEISTMPSSSIVSISRCGQNLYTAFNDTTIQKYYFLNYSTLKPLNSISPYKNYYTAMPGTLKCSNSYFASYLLLLMEDSSSNAYVHLIDNIADELSSIISDYYISNSTFGVFATFLPTGEVAFSNASFFSYYSLNQFILTVGTGQACDEDREYFINVTAFNENNQVSVVFNMSVERNYYPAKVQGIVFTPWVWAAIALSLVALGLTAACLAKKCSKKKNSVSDEVALFNYEFMEFD